jgi:mannose-1-phosphate guanylyltransferase
MKIQAAWGTKKAKSVLAEVYPTLPKISVDYAVMEPAAREFQKAETKGQEARFSVCTVQMDLKWLDVGSWPSFAETVVGDKSGNRVTGEGTPIVLSGKNNLVVTSTGHTVAVLGVEDLIVVHTPDATLVMPRARAEELKALHELVDPKLK